MIVLKAVKKDLELLNTIKSRKQEYLVHIIRNQQRYKVCCKWFCIGKEDLSTEIPERHRVSWLCVCNLRTWFNKTSADLFQIVAGKVATMIANIRNKLAIRKRFVLRTSNSPLLLFLNTFKDIKKNSCLNDFFAREDSFLRKHF